MSNNKVQKIRHELEEIRKNNAGLLTPENVVYFAKSKKTALHSCFTWDDNEAANKYRLYQAAHLIRNVKVEIVTNPKTQETIVVREYVSLPADRQNVSPEVYGYRQINEVLNKNDLRLQLIESIQVEFEQFKNKLKSVSVAADIAARKLSEEIEKERKRTAKKAQVKELNHVLV